MVYQFMCRECGESFEIKASLEDKEKNNPDVFFCPVCKSKDIESQISNVNCNSGGGKSGGCCSGSCDCF